MMIKKVYVKINNIFNRLMIFLYGKQFKCFGKNNKIWFPVKIHCKKNVIIGDNCGINAFINIWGHGGVIIGNNVMIASNTSITSLTHDYSAKSIRFAKVISKSVTIEDDVWIGSNVVIMPGVTIRKGAVIGAGAVVTKDIPEYAIAMGIPAKVVKYRELSNE